MDKPEVPIFDHNIFESVQPWTHTKFNNAEDEFTFTIFSNLTGGEHNRVYEVADT